MNITILGNSGVGKSCLLKRLINDTFTDKYYSTICFDYKIFRYNDKVLKIFDLSGDLKYYDLVSAYIKHNDICILCFDNYTIKSVSYWLGNIYNCNNKCKVFILETKCDTNICIDIKTLSHYFVLWENISPYIYLGRCSAKLDNHIGLDNRNMSISDMFSHIIDNFTTDNTKINNDIIINKTKTKEKCF